MYRRVRKEVVYGPSNLPITSRRARGPLDVIIAFTKAEDNVGRYGGRSTHGINVGVEGEADYEEVAGGCPDGVAD